MRERADKVLTEKGLVTTRSQAKTLIKKGAITVNGVVLITAGELISPDDDIQINSPLYVGRGAFKLDKALEEFNVSVEDKVFLDVGASTGGFTEVLLNHGARKVYAIDVGHDQLAAKLKSDPRVVNLEGTNVRDLTVLPELADGAVMDVSFISVTKVLEAVKILLAPKAPLIVLIKPQFEAGPERLPKDRVIKDEAVRTEILEEVLAFARKRQWTVVRVIESPIEGKSGNKEYLAHLIS